MKDKVNLYNFMSLRRTGVTVLNRTVVEISIFPSLLNDIHLKLFKDESSIKLEEKKQFGHILIISFNFSAISGGGCFFREVLVSCRHITSGFISMTDLHKSFLTAA